MTKWHEQKQTHRIAQNTLDNNTQQTFIFCDLEFSIFLFKIATKTNFPRNVKLPPWYSQRLFRAIANLY